ncbi:MAG: BofC C-terminal domain-containing protein [Bacillota bacterium]|jgi:hypothetical protein
MSRKFIVSVALVLALVLTGWYLRDYLPDLSIGPSRMANSRRSYQQHWQNCLSPDLNLIFHWTFDCGHEAHLSQGAVQASQLGIDERELNQAIATMQIELQQGNDVTLSGRLPTLCPECQAVWLVTELDGCVAVYQGQERLAEHLQQRYAEMPVSRLPEAEQQRLQEGIIVSSEEELARVLEGLDR